MASRSAASSRGSPWTATSLVSRSTSTDATPGTASSSSETARSQWAQLMSGTVKVIVLMPGVYPGRVSAFRHGFARPGDDRAGEPDVPALDDEQAAQAVGAGRGRLE